MKKMFLVTITYSILISILLIRGVDVDAASHGLSNVMGFQIDDNYYDIKWDSTNRINKVMYDDEIIGYTTINIGSAVLKEKLGDETFVTYMVRVTTTPLVADYSKKVLWWTEKWSEYGYSEGVNVSASLVSNTKYHHSSPSFTVDDRSYSVGLSAGLDGSVGISGGVSFTSKALDITNTSTSANNSVNISIDLNDSNWRWDYDRYVYASNENPQLFTYTMKTTRTSSFSQPIEIKSNYATLDREAQWFANVTGHRAAGIYRAYHTVNL